MRSNGLIEDDTTQLICVNITYSIFDAIQGICIPMLMRGVFLVFDTHKPKKEDIEPLP
jgi:hypothetical protein